jgi:glutaredoxin
VTLRIYGKPDCCLCEKAGQVASHLQREFGYEIEHIDISRHPELAARYGTVIPVLTLDGVEIVRSRVTIAGVRAALAAARG